jgi:hypothetical protein
MSGSAKSGGVYTVVGVDTCGGVYGLAGVAGGDGSDVYEPLGAGSEKGGTMYDNPDVETYVEGSECMHPWLMFSQSAAFCARATPHRGRIFTSPHTRHMALRTISVHTHTHTHTHHFTQGERRRKPQTESWC